MGTGRALVIGGSHGGLLAAHLLRHVGWDVVVFERNAEDLTGRGAGISVLPQLIELLARVGIAFDESTGIFVNELIVLDRNGNIVTQRPTARTMSSWGRLYRSLRDPLPLDSYCLGKLLERVEQDTDGVIAIFADGTRIRGDLLVGADGGRSTVRSQFLPDVQPLYAGYVAWRAMLDERDIPADIRAAIFERYTFYLPEGEHLLAYPVPGRNDETQVGQRAYNIVWYRPVAPDKLVDLCTDATGRHHGPAAIPPPLIRPEVVAEIKATARTLVAPQIAEIFARAQPFFQPIFDLESPQIVFGRVALLGDAAFVARPHAGAGVTKAGLDAASLADAVAQEGIDAGLLRYQCEQRPFGRGLVALGRDEGAYLSAQLKPREQHTHAELHRDIDGIILAHNSRSENIRKLLAGRNTTRIYVDADACPVKDEIYRVAARHQLPVTVVANGLIRVPADPLIERVAAGAKPDAADDWIAERAGAGDIVITADIPLASRCVKAGAEVIAPDGRPFTEQTIGMTLAVRNLMHDLRSAGEVTGGPRPFSPRDRSAFLSALDQTIRRLQRARPKV